jgi:hypothetical protein
MIRGSHSLTVNALDVNADGLSSNTPRSPPPPTLAPEVGVCSHCRRILLVKAKATNRIMIIMIMIIKKFIRFGSGSTTLVTSLPIYKTLIFLSEKITIKVEREYSEKFLNKTLKDKDPFRKKITSCNCTNKAH